MPSRARFVCNPYPPSKGLQRTGTRAARPPLKFPNVSCIFKMCLVVSECDFTVSRVCLVVSECDFIVSRMCLVVVSTKVLNRQKPRAQKERLVPYFYIGIHVLYWVAEADPHSKCTLYGRHMQHNFAAFILGQDHTHFTWTSTSNMTTY